MNSDIDVIRLYLMQFKLQLNKLLPSVASMRSTLNACTKNFN